MSSPAERRKYRRLSRNYKTRVTIKRTSKEVEGITDNLSQGGAYIFTPSWSSLQENDQMTMNLLLPPEMTGQPDTITLTGPAKVKRVDKDREGIAIEFLKELKAFEPSW